MGRWRVWGRGRFAILLSQAGGQLKRARSRVSLRDDSQPPHGLQPPGKSQTRRAPTKNYSPRHAEREDAARDGVTWSAARPTECRTLSIHLFILAILRVDSCDFADRSSFLSQADNPRKDTKQDRKSVV